MKGKFNIILYVLLSTLLLVIGGLHAFAYVFSFSDQERIDYFKARNITEVPAESTVDGATIFNVSTATQMDSAILYIHGAPGTWDAWKWFLSDSSLLGMAQQISIDRPNYGKSRMNGKWTSIEAQAKSILEFIKFKNIGDLTVVGHSYGGPIAAEMAYLDSAIVDRVIMISPLIDPESEPIFWYSYFGKWKITRWLLPNLLKKAADEKFSHANELEKMKTHWSALRKPILHIHGLQDGLAPPEENINFSKNEISKELLELEILAKEGHLVIFENPELIRDIIIKFIRK